MRAPRVGADAAAAAAGAADRAAGGPPTAAPRKADSRSRGQAVAAKAEPQDAGMVRRGTLVEGAGGTAVAGRSVGVTEVGRRRIGQAGTKTFHHPRGSLINELPS